jgi:hypothetical protein
MIYRYVFSSVIWCLLRITNVRFILYFVCLVSFNSSMTDFTNGIGNDYPSGSSEFTSVFSEMNVAQLYVLCCGLSTTVFVPFPLKTIAFIVCPSIYTSGFSLWYLQTNQYPTRKVYGRDILMYLFVFYVSFIFSIFVIIT